MKNGTLGDKVYASTLNIIRALNRWQVSHILLLH